MNSILLAAITSAIIWLKYNKKQQANTTKSSRSIQQKAGCEYSKKQ